MNHRTQRRLLTALKWLLSLTAFAFILKEINPEQLASMLQAQQPQWLVLAIFLMVFQAFISTFRWQKIIETLRPECLGERTVKELFSFNYICMFFNCCLPGTIGGDVLRVLMLRSPNIPLSTSSHSVIIDRLFAVLAIVIMVAAGLPWMLPMLGFDFAWIGILATIVGFALLHPILSFASNFLSKKPQKKLIHLIKNFIDSVLVIIWRRHVFIALLAQAICAHAVFCLAVWAIAQSLSIDFSFYNTLLFIPPILLVSLLPISVGGWGVRELLMVYLLALIGIEKEPALMISVQLGIWLMVASLPGFYLWLVRKKGAV